MAMPLRHPEAIFHMEKRLAECLAAVEALGETQDPQAIRTAIQDVLTHALAEGIEVIQQRFMMNPTSVAALKERSWLVDQIIRLAMQTGYEYIVSKKSPDIVMIAVGGYGRGELFFHSDIDILLLTRQSEIAEGSELEKLIHFVLYLLWDSGLKTGHSVRHMDELLKDSRQDDHLRTSLLEARYVAGSRSLFNRFVRRFKDEVVQGTQAAFIRSKLQEWANRHEKYGDSRYRLEPNIKEGRGGLRDLHMMMWLANYCFDIKMMRDLAAIERISREELNEFRRCRKFLQLVRLHLHDFAGYPDENLSFDAQIDIAKRLQYRGENANEAVERFMKRYFLTTKTVGRLTRNFNFMLEEEFLDPMPQDVLPLSPLPQGFELKSGRIHFSDQQLLQQRPETVMELFYLSHELDREIHPQSWQWVTRNLSLLNRDFRQNDKVKAWFLEILCGKKNPESTLRRMNESGVLGRFVPDFRRIVGQMQFDLYHNYTVDEHTIIALGFLHQIESGRMMDKIPVLQGRELKLESRNAVYVALLCHDIAKGRQGDHARNGSKIAKALAKRLGLTSTEAKLAEWLVAQHLYFSMTAFKRDLQDPKTMEDFTARIDSPERLLLLFLLTVADIHAVGPKIWNSWKGTLLQQLYERASLALSPEIAVTEKDEPSLNQQLQKIASPEDTALIEDYVAGLEQDALDSADVESHRQLLPLWRKVSQQAEPFAIEFKDITAQNITEVTLLARDSVGLFAQIAGVIALAGANILHARIATRKDGIVVDQFGIQDQRNSFFDEERRQQRIVERLEFTLRHQQPLKEHVRDLEQRYQSSTESFSITPKITIDNQSSKRYSIMEVRCRDRRGLLYELAECLSQLGLNIASAHISTYGAEAVDVFYVKDLDGHKLTDHKQQKTVKKKILTMLKKAG
jgi:[protein-PII] uridylyltransferase